MAEFENEVEQQAQPDPPSKALYNALASTNKYELPDYDTFKNDMKDINKRKKLLETAKADGLYGKDRSINDFSNHFFTDVDSKKKESTVASSPVAKQSISPVSDVSTNFLSQHPEIAQTVSATPKVAPITAPVKEKPEESFFKMPNLGNKESGDIFGYSAPKKEKTPEDKLKELATSETRQETAARTQRFKEQFATKFGAELKEPTYDDIESRSNDFISKEFNGFAPDQQPDIAEYLKNVAISDPKRYNEIVSRTEDNQGSMTQREKASLLQNIMLEKLTKQRQDIDILEARAKTGKGNIDPVLAANLVKDYNRTFQDVKDVIKAFPEEYERQKLVRANNDAMTIQKDDSFGTKLYKQAFSTIGAVQNTVLDAGISVLKFANSIADQATQSTDTRGLADKTVDVLSDYLDSWKFGQPTKYKDAEDLQGDQSLKVENALPSLIGSLTNMAMLAYGGSGSALKLTLAGAATSYNGAYQTALDKGMSNDTAQKYGLFQAGIQGLLENVSPNFGVIEFEKIGLKQGLEYLAKNPKATLGEYGKKVYYNLINENAQELLQGSAEKVVNGIANQAVGKDSFETNMTAKELGETVAMTTAVTLLASSLGRGHFKAQHAQSLELLKDADPNIVAKEVNDLIKARRISTEQGQRLIDISSLNATAKQIAQAFNTDENIVSQELEPIANATTAEDTQQESKPTTAEAKTEAKTEAKAVIPEEKKVKEISEEELLNETPVKEVVKETVKDEPKATTEPTPKLVETEPTTKPDDTAASGTIEPIQPMSVNEQPSDKAKEQVETPVSGDVVVIKADKQNVDDRQASRDVVGTDVANIDETPDQRTERVKQTVSKLSRVEKKAALGIINETKDAALFDVLSKKEKANVQAAVSEVFKTDKTNQQTVETKASQQPVIDKTKRKSSEGGKKNTTRGVFGNTKAIKDFEPRTIEEKILQQLALGQKFRLSDWGHLSGEEKRTWRQNQIANEQAQNEHSLDGNYYEEDTNVAVGAFENVTRQFRDRHEAARELKRIQEERTQQESGISEREIERAEALEKYAEERAQKNNTEPIEIDEDTYQRHSDHLNNIEELEAAAASDAEMAKQHDELFNKIINDPQYKNSDGSFNFDKLHDNIENGFEPDILNLGIFEDANKITPKDETTRQQADRITNIAKQSVRPIEKDSSNKSVATDRGREERPTEPTKRQPKGVNEQKLDTQIAAKKAEVKKASEKLAERAAQRQELKKKAAKQLKKENQSDIFGQKKGDKLFDDPLSVGTKDQNVFTAFDKETQALQTAHDKAAKELSILEKSRAEVQKSDKAQQALFDSKSDVTETVTSEQKEKENKGTLSSVAKAKEIIDKGYQAIKKGYGEKGAKKYFDAFDAVFNTNKSDVIEYRYGGIVVKEGDKYMFYPILDTDNAKWRVGKSWDISKEFSTENHMSPTWRTEFERAKKENDLKALDTLYSKVKVALNGIAQSKGEVTVKAFQDFKKEIEDYATELKATEQKPTPSVQEQAKPQETPQEPTKTDSKPTVKEQNFTQFAAENGYPDDNDTMFQAQYLGGRGLMGQRQSNKSIQQQDNAFSKMLSDNKEAHREYEKAILEGRVIDPSGKLTREGILKRDYDFNKKELESKIRNAESGIERIEGLGKISHLDNGKLKKGYQGAVDDYNEQIKRHKAELEKIKNSLELALSPTKNTQPFTAKANGSESVNQSEPITASLSIQQRKIQYEINIVDKQIEQANKGANKDRVKILEKKKAELVRRFELSKEVLQQSTKPNLPTEVDDTKLEETLTDKKGFEFDQKEMLDKEIEQAERELTKANRDVLMGANPVNMRQVEALVKLGYLKFKRFLYDTGRKMSLSDFADALKVPISERLKKIYNRVTDIFNSENSAEFRDKLGFIQDFRRNYQDKNVAVKMLYEDMKRAGLEITDNINFAEMQELTVSKITNAQREVAEWFRGKTGDNLKGVQSSKDKSWVGRVNKEVGSYEEQRDFMYARHALDFNARAREIFDNRRNEEVAALDEKINALQDEYVNNPTAKLKEKITKLTQEKADLLNEPYPLQPSGMTDAEAQDIINKAQSDPDKYNRMVKLADEFRKETVIKRIDLMEESGLINAETAENMRTGKRDGYVSEMPNYLPFKVKSENFEDKPTVSQGALGTKIFGIQVTDKYGKVQRYDPIVMAMTELQATQQAAENNKALLALYEAVKQTPFGQHIKIVNTRGTYAADEQGDLKETRPEGKVTVHDLLAQHAIPFRDNGKIKYIYFNPVKLANGSTVQHPIVKALKANTSEQGAFASALMNLYRTVVNYLRLIRTSYNLGFAIDNPFRDLGEALTNISNVGDKNDTEKIRLGILKNMPKSFVYFFNPMKGNETILKEMADNFQEMREQGVMMSWRNYEGVDEVVTNFEEDIKRIEQGKGRTAKEKAQVFFKALAIISESTENMTRLAVYSSMKQNGYSPQKAAYVAKNITLNFEKKGEQTKYTNLVWMFSNAGIQGASRMVSAAKSKNFWRFGFAMTAFAMANRALLINNMDDDDDDKWIYNDLENKGRTMFYNPLDPKNPIRLPKPYSAMRIFLNLGESMADVAHGKRTATDAAFNNMTETLAGAVDPIGGAGGSMTNYVPTEILKQFVQVQSNESWSGMPILKGEGYMDKKKKEEYIRSNTNTKPIFDKAALSIYDKTGMNIQPPTLEFIWKNYGDNAVKSIADYGKIGEAIYDTATGKEVNKSEVPVLKRFYHSADEKKGQVVFGILDLVKTPEAMTKEQIRYTESQLPKLRNDATINPYIIKMIIEGLSEAKDPNIKKQRDTQLRAQQEQEIQAKETKNK